MIELSEGGVLCTVKFNLEPVISGSERNSWVINLGTIHLMLYSWVQIMTK